jgi:hypothetical protein
LFHNNRSTKPAARALHFISSLLNEDVSEASDKRDAQEQFNFTLEGLPVGARHLLFKNSNGTYFLVIWNDSPVYHPYLGHDITVTPVQVRK